jgi:hypothetical protein
MSGREFFLAEAPRQLRRWAVHHDDSAVPVMTTIVIMERPHSTVSF